MKFPKPHSLKEIALLLNCKFDGEENSQIFGMNEIHVVEPGDIVFVDHPKYYDKALNSSATTILINKNVTCPEGKSLLISDDPFRDFNKLAQYFHPFIAANSPIAPTAKIGENTIIQPNCFIGNHVTIGKNCLIHSNVSIYDHTTIGDNVIIHAGTVIGADAFYYQKRNGIYERLVSSGLVIINDDVEIGAVCTIDKGVTGNTMIGNGTKIDDQVHIGHDTMIGKNCLIAAQTGISGCVTIEDDVTIWGQVGIVSGIKIGPQAIIMSQTGVTKSIEGGKRYFGMPAQELNLRLKQLAYIKKLPELFRKTKKDEPIISNS